MSATAGRGVCHASATLTGSSLRLCVLRAVAMRPSDCTASERDVACANARRESTKKWPNKKPASLDQRRGPGNNATALQRYSVTAPPEMVSKVPEV